MFMEGCAMNQTRLNTSNQKHICLVETAKTLFFKHGVKRVTVEEICEKAHVSKVTFYKFFSNKDAIVRQIRDDLMNTGFSKFDEIGEMDIPYTEKIDLMTRWRVEYFSQMKSEFIEDIISFEETMEEMKKRFIKNILIAQEKGEIRRDLSPGLIWLTAEKLNEIALNGNWKDAVSDFNELHRQLRTLYFHGLLSK
jgi:AcrR family transcriptional regulator